MNLVDEAVVPSAVIEQHKELVSAIDAATHREPSTMSNHVLYLADLLGSCSHSRPRR
jgi:hypothetical protein